MNEVKMKNKNEIEVDQRKFMVVNGVFRKLEELIRAFQEEVRQNREKMRQDGHLK